MHYEFSKDSDTVRNLEVQPEQIGASIDELNDNTAKAEEDAYKLKTIKVI